MIASMETFVRAIRFSFAPDDSSELIITSEPCKFPSHRFARGREVRRECLKGESGGPRVKREIIRARP